MERQDLKKLSFPELKKEMLKYGLQPANSRARYIDLLINHTISNNKNTLK